MLCKKLVDEIEAVAPSWGEHYSGLAKMAIPLDFVWQEAKGGRLGRFRESKRYAIERYLKRGELSKEQIAVEVGCNVTTVRDVIRALKKMKEAGGYE